MNKCPVALPNEKEALPTLAGTDQNGPFTQTIGSLGIKKHQVGKKQQYTYTIQGDNIVGNGTFGVVYFAIVNETGETVAIKKVFQDKRYKNRELQMMKDIGNHPNVIGLRNYFYTKPDESQKEEGVYLNIIMDYVPETLYRMIKYYSQKGFPNILLKLYSYQLLRSLAYIQGLGICHRDIKPTNVLVDPRTHNLKLCDFGCAKKLSPGDANISYICSRFYRAPELMFQATEYSYSIDMWSVGCVIAEMALGEPIFAGETSLDQLIEIIKVLGTPSPQQIYEMNPYCEHFNLPQIKSISWSRVFQKCRVDPLAIDLISKILIYSPQNRLDALQSLAHPYFDELRHQKCRINNQKLPDLFNFTESIVKNKKAQLNLFLLVEIGDNCDSLIDILIPDWYSSQFSNEFRQEGQYNNYG